MPCDIIVFTCFIFLRSHYFFSSYLIQLSHKSAFLTTFRLLPPFIIFQCFFVILTLTLLDCFLIHFIHKLYVSWRNCYFIQDFPSSLSNHHQFAWFLAASSLFFIITWHSLLLCVHQLNICCLKNDKVMPDFRGTSLAEGVCTG